jgi:uncharacterized damage-inducible protein DinB
MSHVSQRSWFAGGGNFFVTKLRGIMTAMDAASVSPDLRYPVGKFDIHAPVTAEQRRECVEVIADLPGKLRDAVADLTDEQLDTPYRPGGWTVRQVVHHLPDSHLNSYIRFKLALTEETPTIKPYDEAAWAELPEAKSGPIEPSLKLLEYLHRRWVPMLNAMQEGDWERTFRHPERNGLIRLDGNLALYGWHCRHHLAHVTGLKQRMGW